MRVVTLVLVALLAGCGLTGNGLSTSTADRGALTGVKTGSVSCPNRLPDVQPKEAGDVDGVVREFAVCTLGGGGPARIGPLDERFGTLQQGLARADVEPEGAVVCPAIARSLIPVYARTADGWWSLHQPVDACRQVQPGVAELVLAVAMAPTGLTGRRVTSDGCRPWPDNADRTDAVTGVVRSVSICGGVLAGGESSLIPLRGTLAEYVAAFARPDEKQGTSNCLAYADFFPNVISHTTTGYWSLHVPVDGCGHIQPTAKALLSGPAS